MVINVTTDSDAIYGNANNVSSLLATAPNAGGISLRAALNVIKNSPGTYTIEFDPRLKGATINVGSWANQPTILPPLLSGNVTINGDIDSDGKPDLTINNTLSGFSVAFQIISCYNTLYSLNITNFLKGVQFYPPSPRQVFSNNTLAKLDIASTVPEATGIGLSTKDPNGRSFVWTGQGVNVTGNSWVNTVIMNNTISVPEDGVAFNMFSSGDQLKGLQIIGNDFSTTDLSAYQTHNLYVGNGAGSKENQISNAVIAYNHFSGSPYKVIRLAAGSAGASDNSITNVMVFENVLLANSPTLLGSGSGNPQGIGVNGINLIYGDGSTANANSTYRPITYAENNSIASVWIVRNVLKGLGDYGL
jgi:hypothetical protein